MEARPNNGTVALSVIIPVYNEAENIHPLMGELQTVLEARQEDYEILWVDDGSHDRTAPLLDDLTRWEPGCRVLRHRRRSGQSACHATGFYYARGTTLVTLDGDGQNDPADLPSLLAGLREDVACVSGIRENRQDHWVRRVSSSIANGFRNWVTGDRISDAGCAFRVLRAECLWEVPRFNGMHRFLPTLLRAQGFRVVEQPVHHRPRLRGSSKYGISDRLWRGIVDCLAIRWYRTRALSAQRVSNKAEQTDPSSRQAS